MNASKTSPKSSASTDLVASPAKQSPQALVNEAQDAMRPTVLLVDDDTRASILKEAAQTEAVVAFLLQKGAVAGLDMLNSATRLRRLFPASDEVRAILGEDACDLVGQTQAYKDAMAGVNGEAMKALVSRLRRDGYPSDVAENIAKDRMETVRKGVSAHYRRYVDQLALNTCDGDRTAAAALLLAHGFQHSTAIETKKAPQVIRPGQTVEIAEGEGEGVRSVSGALLKVLNPAPKAGDTTPANEPADQADQTPSGQTADAEISKAVDGQVTDPATLINEAIGMLRTAAKLVAANPKGLTKAQRTTHRKNLASAYRAIVGELQETLDDSFEIVVVTP